MRDDRPLDFIAHRREAEEFLIPASVMAEIWCDDNPVGVTDTQREDYLNNGVAIFAPHQIDQIRLLVKREWERGEFS